MLQIIAETDSLLVFNKPANISLLKDRQSPHCLWDEIKSNYNKAQLVHRLDKGTSGVLLVAKTRQRQSQLTEMFSQRRIHKFYIAVVTTPPAIKGSGKIDLPLRPGRKSRYRVAGLRDQIVQTQNRWHLSAQESVSEQHERFPSFTALRRLHPIAESPRARLLLKPTTGRTHQLRVHLSWIGHPICGDHLYGKPNSPEQIADRLLLHCHKLVVPGVGVYKAPVPF